MQNATRKLQNDVDDHRRSDPLMPLDWRWRAAERHLENGTQPADWEDPDIARAVDYLRRSADTFTAGADTAVNHPDPDIAEAHRLFLDAGGLRDEVDARLLCDHMQAVSVKTGVSVGALLVYGKFFYCVLEKLTAIDWLMNTVVRLPGMHERGVSERDVWRYWALSPDPDALEILIADHRGTPEPSIPDRHLRAEKYRYSLREFVTPASDQAAMAAIIAEGRRRFGPYLGIEPESERDRQQLDIGMQILDLAYGSPKTRRRRQRHRVHREITVAPRSAIGSFEKEVFNAH